MLIDYLIEKIKKLAAPIVVGLDPRLSQIPTFIKDEIFNAQGRTPKALADIFYSFNKTIIDHVYDLVPAIKPQIAMYEQLGPEGFDCYLRTIAYAKSKGLFVIGDIKRGDIATTATAYSNGHIGRVDIEGEIFEISKTDFITLNPYMGFNSIEPYLTDCKQYDKGLFILVKTSNPNSCQVQDIVAPDGRPIYAYVGDLVSQWGADFIGRWGFSSVGAVVGATHPADALTLRKSMPHTFFLVPGYGAQGGSGKDLKGLFNKDCIGAIVNNSRGITGAYLSDKFKNQYSEKEFGQASRAAVLDMKMDLEMHIK